MVREKLTKNEVEEMVRAYKDYYHIDDLCETAHTAYTWFSSDALLDFLENNGFRLDTIDATGEKCLIIPNVRRFSGVRIYFGRRTKETLALSVDPGKDVVDYAHRTTSILVATRPSKDGVSHHSDVYGTASTAKELAEKVAKVESMKPSEKSAMMKVLVDEPIDYATLCPPNCNHTMLDVAYAVYPNSCDVCPAT